MTVRFMDSVSTYGKGQILTKWDGTLSPMKVGYSSWGDEEDACLSHGRHSGNALLFSSGFGGFVSKVLDTSSESYHVVSLNLLIRDWAVPGGGDPDPLNVRQGVLAAVKPANPSTSSSSTWSLLLGDDGSLTLKLNGHVSLNGVGTTVITTTPSLVSLEIWKQIDVELDATAGFVRLYVEDILVGSASISESDIFDPTNPVEEVIYRQPATFQGRLDVMHVLDGSGSFNNTRIGLVAIDAQSRNVDSTDFDTFGDSKVTDSTPLVPLDFGICPVGDESCRVSASNDIPVTDGDQGGLETGTLGRKILMGHAASGGSLAVQVIATVRKGNSDTTTLAFIADDGTIESVGDSAVISTTYKNVSHIFNEDPRDNTQWTSAKLSAQTFGLKKI